MKKLSILLSVAFLIAGCMKQPTGTPVENGTLTEVSIPASDPSITETNAYIYMPPAYSSSKTYPVLYLLHGFGSNYQYWQGVCDIKYILDYMIAKDEIKPMIVVMPNGNNMLGGSFYTNSVDSATPAFGQYETYIMHDVISYVDSAYNTEKASGRAIAGISMGGYGAVKLAALYPDSFKVAAGFSGVYYFNLFLQKDAEGKTMVDRVIEENGGYINPLNADIEHPLTAMMLSMAGAFSPRVRDSSYFNPLDNKFLLSSYPYPPYAIGVELPFTVIFDPSDSTYSYQLKDTVWQNEWMKNDVQTIVTNNASAIKGAGTYFYLDAGADDDFGLNYHMQSLDAVMNAASIPHQAEEFNSVPGYPESIFPAGHTTHLYLRVSNGLTVISQHIE